MLISEILLVAVVLLMQILAVIYRACRQQIISLTLLFTFAILFYMGYFIDVPASTGFSGSYEISSHIIFYKSLILVLAIMSIVIYRNLQVMTDSHLKMEFITLVLLSTLGTFIAISARDFLILFCGLELQALSGYALAAFNSKECKSSEAGLKYFVLGALMSALMLFGISFLYGFSGSINFHEIEMSLNNHVPNIGVIVGAILVVAAILFKLSAAPLHIWTPDVYEGAPVASVTFFAVAQKVGMLVVLLNILGLVIGDYTSISVDIIKIVAILSMVVGALGAIRQHSLKRLMAYSTVLNVGYVLVGVALNTAIGKYAAFIYMFIYVMGVIGFFSCLVSLFGQNADNATFDDLKAVASKRKALATCIAIIMFSMIGLPPLAGFFGKYYVFYNAVKQGEFTLAILGVLTSVIAAFYYLKVIKIMYFVESDIEMKIIPTNRGLSIISGISVAFILFFAAVAPSYIL
ncbi:MAG: NADH-quinone oxidoreductase subunit N [Rickettsiaceae bacterium]|nr:NADH-quinone oxidoreductase subunit N [Rickettsiaceae bacterium]